MGTQAFSGEDKHQSRSWRWVDLVSSVLLLVSGFGLAIPGAYLLTLGGSPYYLVAGIVMIACAWLVRERRAAGRWVFAGLVMATTVWSLVEVGADGWALMPRLVFFLVAGAWLLATAPRGQRKGPALTMLAAAGIVGVAFGFAAARPAPMIAPVRTSQGMTDTGGEWVAYGGTNRGTRFSDLTEITPANVDQMEPAWTYRTGLFGPDGKRKAGLQLTPLMVDGTLYGCTAFGTVFALDPITGRELWRTERKLADSQGGHPVCRGLAFFRAGTGVRDCPTRLVVGTVDSRLIALDARTGAACAGFGAAGEVDLTRGMGDFPARWAHPTSPPTIVGGVAVIGHYVSDNQSTHVPPGVVRGYDATTGAFRWAFDPGRPDDHREPPPGQSYTPSTPNSWTIASGDDALGLVYVPMGNGSPDFVGHGRHPSTKRFASALVALDAQTGAVRWTFQAVHHDLWDYDLAAQPALIDLPLPGGERVPAMVLPGKHGEIFLLDRRTGQPISPVEEHAVPQTVLPGEQTSKTQPFSVGMPNFAGPDLTEDDMWGITPFDQMYCRILFREADYRGRFTPPQLKPTIRFPGELGGIDWGSVSIDERRGLLIVNSNRMADRDQLITRAQADREGLVPRTDASVHSAPGGPMAGTPWAVHWGPFLTGLGVPCQQPPYGLISALDLRTRKLVWQLPLGDARNSGAFGIALGLPIPLGAPNIGGSVATAGGVVFIAATQDEMFRAIDTATGRTLWQYKLPVAGHATPMSFRGRDGHQYVVIAAGGGSLKNATGDYLIAFRLRPQD